MTMKLLTHGPSAGAKALANELGIKRLLRNKSAWKPRPQDVILNWGSHSVCGFSPWRWLNDPINVSQAASKLASLTIMQQAGVCVPDFTTDAQTARHWLYDGKTLVERRLDKGSSGRGIILWKPEDYDKFIHSPKIKLVTVYVPKYDEYRIHVMRGEVIDIQQKRRKHGEECDNQIRTHSQGWIFAREDCSPHERVLEQAITAVKALGLDFGAADIGWTKKSKRATVYEVNTAPGLEGTTVKSYANSIKKLA